LGCSTIKYPDLQIILGHWGKVVLFYLERLNSLGRVAHLRRPIGDYIRQNLCVTPSGMWSQSYLQRTLELVEPERFCSPRITPTNTARAGRVDP
jgi:predicted TIM-barrel fold metal-dependent hydrolase